MQRTHLALLVACTWFLVGCFQNIPVRVEPTSPPIIITEVVDVAGVDVVITIEIAPSPTAVIVTPPPTIPAQEEVVELDVALAGAVGAPDPQLATASTTIDYVTNVYAGLTRINESTSQIVPELAQSWSTQEEGRIWQFNLRDDIFWVRGVPSVAGGLLQNQETQRLVEVAQIRPINANDVVSAIQRACDPRTNAPDVYILFIIENCQAIANMGEPTEEQLATIGIRTLSDYSLEVRLTKPAAYFLSITTLPIFRPIPADLVADEDDDWLDLDLFRSSGPFLYSPLSDFEADVPELVLQRNPHWPTDLTPPIPETSADVTLQHAQRVNLYRYPSRTAAYEVYNDDKLDLMPLPAELEEEAVSAEVPPPFITNGDVFYLGFNYDDPEFSIPQVRRAFSKAIDRERLIAEVYDGIGRPMRLFVPPSVVHASPDLLRSSFDPDGARQLLSSVGFANCEELGQISYLVDATDLALQHAETVIDMWSEELLCRKSQFEIEQVQFGTLLAYTRPGTGELRPDIWDLAWSGFYPDAHDYYNTVLHCVESENRPNRPCSQIDGLIALAAKTTDLVQRDELYRQISVALFGNDGEFPIIPLYVRGDYQLVQNWITRSDGKTDRAQFGGTRYDFYLVNQQVKALERSQ